MKMSKIVYLIVALAAFNNNFGMNQPEERTKWNKRHYQNVRYVLDAEKRLINYLKAEEESFTPETKEKFIAIEIENINTMKHNFTALEKKIYNELKGKS